MEHGTAQILFALLRSVLNGTKAEIGISRIVPETFSELLSISRKHNIEHLVVYGLQQNGLLSEEYSQITNKIFEAAYRCEQICFEFERLCTALEEAKIPFIPLKGAVMRKYYPETWMRTSCDIDVLVHEHDSEKAVSALIDGCNYTYHKKGSHDIALITPGKIRVELHYNLIESNVSEEASAVLSRVWESANICEGFRWQYEMSDEMFYFYHIAHMAKHFENGGCGIKPFADLWFLNSSDGEMLKKREELLRQGNLLKFAKTAQKLSRVWFDNEKTDSPSLIMEDYVLYGGAFGSLKNRIAVQQQKKGGKIKYLWFKIFVPYDEIKFYYPVLQKYRFLTPFMEVYRWFKLIFGGRLRSVSKEIKMNQSVSDETTEDTRGFLFSIGLLNDDSHILK